MRERPKLKFLAVVWGARYVDEFCRVSLPSYLAPGNLPHLAIESDLEVLVMTSEATLPAFEAQHLFRYLRTLCPVRFILIDDLITSAIYGVTLTLAFARGIRDSGAAQTDTTFVFMNADFVLANGALAAVLDRLKSGSRCILAPSLRVRSEAVAPILYQNVDSATGQLIIAPRNLVRLALDNLHPTVIGKAVSQNFVTSTTHNQIYWQLDGDTLLARHYLIFMLAIRPEVALDGVNSYCDYGFVPELVPSGTFTVITDSDEFFMLELQATAQERKFLRCGASIPSRIARELSSWTTVEQRRVSEIDIVFHAANLPAALPDAVRDLAAFMARIHSMLRQPPASHVNHPYWTGGVESWRLRREQDGCFSLPSELGQGVIRIRRPGTLGPIDSILRLGRRILGTAAQRQIWRPGWADQRLAREALNLAKAPTTHRLLVCASDSILLAQPTARDRTEIGLGDFLRNPVASSPRGADHVLLHVPRAQARKIRNAVVGAEKVLSPGGQIAVFIDHPEGDAEFSDFAAELPGYLEDVLPDDWLDWTIDARFVGGRWARFLSRTERMLFFHMVPLRLAQVPRSLLAMAAWSVVGVLFIINNLSNRVATSTCPPYCSAMLIELRRRNRAGVLIDKGRSGMILTRDEAV